MTQRKNSSFLRVVGGSHLTLHTKRTEKALQVCDMLEALADDLPQMVPALWAEARGQCGSVLRPHFALLQDAVIPQLMGKVQDGPAGYQLLAELRLDCSDRMLALSELDDLFCDALTGDKFGNEPEALGFALRGHFDPLRRDLRWQTSVLWPMVERLFSDAEIARLNQTEGD